MKGEQKGARVLNTGSQPERGRTTRGESGAEGNSYKPTTQYQGGGGTDSPEPVYGQKSQVPTSPRRKKASVRRRRE